MADQPPMSESAAYAMAAWSRFDEEIDDRLLKAVVGAFALVAASDGNLAAAESDRFFALLRSRARLFPRLDFDSAEDAFRDVATALLSDPESGRQRALGYVAEVKQTASHCQLVMAAAQVAAEADERDRAQERSVLAEIRRLLEIDG